MRAKETYVFFVTVLKRPWPEIQSRLCIGVKTKKNKTFPSVAHSMKPHSGKRSRVFTQTRLNIYFHGPSFVGIHYTVKFLTMKTWMYSKYTGLAKKFISFIFLLNKRTFKTTQFGFGLLSYMQLHKLNICNCIYGSKYLRANSLANKCTYIYKLREAQKASYIELPKQIKTLKVVCKERCHEKCHEEIFLHGYINVY